jgi:hypothetical protein
MKEIVPRVDATGRMTGCVTISQIGSLPSLGRPQAQAARFGREARTVLGCYCALEEFSTAYSAPARWLRGLFACAAEQHSRKLLAHLTT